MMNCLNIKDYFDKGMEDLRQASIERDMHPILTIIDATDGDAGNQIYIRKKMEDMEQLGWGCRLVCPKNSGEINFTIFFEVVDGVIVQMPLAEKFKEFDINSVPAYLDCDGLTRRAKVLPATVRGIIDYLDDCGFGYEGKNAVVLGRSEIVGKPMAKALLEKNMTVSVCHSKTSEETKARLLEDANLVIAAVGHPGVVTRSICPKAFVVDVGISRVDGKIVGDFVEDPWLEGYGSTPVPGGVGLLTRLGLARNLWDLAVDRWDRLRS